jgi:hypothetical protein
MAMIHVHGFPDDQSAKEIEVVLNTQHLVMAYPDPMKPDASVVVQLSNGNLIRVGLPIGDLWQLIQRET